MSASSPTAARPEPARTGRTPFGARLHAALRAKGPLAVGIDPHPALLTTWGLPDDAAGVDAFAQAVVDALGAQVAVLKPQSAFFERHGSAGVAALERCIAAGRAAGALVLLDVKRGDVASTMVGYADAYVRPTASLAADALTVTPYTGFGALRPVLDAARGAGAGVFVVTLTSNPEGAAVQRARQPDGQTVAGAVLAEIAACNAGESPLGSVGAVVGATLAEAGEDLAVNGPLLAPGLGAQGGTAADLARIFGAARANVLPSVSRSVLAAGPDPGRLRAAAARAADEFATALAGAV